MTNIISQKMIHFTFYTAFLVILFLPIQSYAQLGEGIKLLNKYHVNNKETEKKPLSCKQLEELVIQDMNKFIYSNAKFQPSHLIVRSIKSNISTMELHKCDKDALYTHLNNHLTFDDPLYFQLNEIL